MCNVCDLMVIIPQGYDTTKLDSFYTDPILKKANGALPECATGVEPHFGREWQFWSRHLTDDEWKRSVRGFEVYLDYIREALRRA